MEIVRWSSISLASLRASSTGCTDDRNVRPKRPSTRPPILRSMSRKTLTVGSRDGNARSAAALPIWTGGRPGGGDYSREHRGDPRTDGAGAASEHLGNARPGEGESEPPQGQRLHPPLRP